MLTRTGSPTVPVSGQPRAALAGLAHLSSARPLPPQPAGRGSGSQLGHNDGFAPWQWI